MTSLAVEPSDLLGAQEPRICSVPPYVSSTGAEAIELAALAGLDLDPWQQFVLDRSLGERPDGKWAAFEIGLVVSRQNGKGGLLEARELAGLFLLGERLIIHSAHQFDTSMEAFERLLALIENTPQLRRRIRPRGVSRSHGAEGIALQGGQRIRFRTRTTGGGRGFTCDCLILDEAMIIPDAMHGALLPTLSARPNPQVWYTGSAVDQDIHQHGLVLSRIRERGLKGDDPSLAFFEWSADRTFSELTPEVAGSPELWAQANPALGIRISQEYVSNEYASFMGGRGFVVERLGVGDWPNTDPNGLKVIDPEAWSDCVDQNSSITGKLYFAFDVTPDRSATCISVAGRRDDGEPHVEVIEHRRGTGWVVDRLVELAKKYRTRSVYCDGYGPAGSLIPEIENHKLKVEALNAKEMAAGCGIFYDSVMTEADEDTGEIGPTLHHLGQLPLTQAVMGSSTRPLGDAWAWSRKNSTVDISPLVSCTVALWALTSAPRRKKTGLVNLNEVMANA